jgi:hypothetical protein
MLLLKTDERTITPNGVRFENRYYANAELAERVGERVVLRYNPEDKLSVLVIAADGRHPPTEAFWTEAPNTPYTTEQHVEQRHRIAGVLRRMTVWAANAESERAYNRTDWEAAESAAMVFTHAEQIAKVVSPRLLAGGATPRRIGPGESSAPEVPESSLDSTELLAGGEDEENADDYARAQALLRAVADSTRGKAKSQSQSSAIDNQPDSNIKGVS